MKLFKTVISSILIATLLTHSSPSFAFTDEAIKLVRQWIIENGEKVARAALKAAVARAAFSNSDEDTFVSEVGEIKGVEGESQKIDSFCAPGSEGVQGCKDLIAGGATIRSCGGKICGLDAGVALIVEGKCGMLSDRNPLKVAEFETSKCAGEAWGALRSKPELLQNVIGANKLDVNSIFEFKKAIMLGIMDTFEKDIVGTASGYKTEDKVDAKLKEYLANDTKGLIKEAVIKMANKSSDEAAYQEALRNPRVFAAEVANAVRTAALNTVITAKAGVNLGPEVGAGGRIATAVTTIQIKELKSIKAAEAKKKK